MVWLLRSGQPARPWIDGTEAFKLSIFPWKHLDFSYFENEFNTEALSSDSPDLPNLVALEGQLSWPLILVNDCVQVREYLCNY